jgi:putative peptidoglycan lipid II flippase
MAGRDAQRATPGTTTSWRRARVGRLLRALSSVSGVVRDIVIAAVFRRDETDTFFVAFTLPSALRVLLADAMTSSAVAPVVSRKLRKEGEPAARVLYGKLRGILGAFLLLVTVAGIALAHPITVLLAAGYRRRSGEFDRTEWLTMTLFPYLLFAGLAAMGGVALHIKRRAASDWTRLAFSGSVLCASLLLPQVLDARGIDRAQALAVGVLVGGLVPLIIDWRARRAIGWTAPAVIDLKLPELRDVARRLGPVALALAPFSLELFVSRRLLSEMQPGAQSAFWWAMRICEVLQGVVAAVVARVPLRLRTRTGETDAQANARAATHRLRLALFAALPAALLVSVLAHPIVVAALQRGAFDATMAYETSRALVWQGAAIWVGATLPEIASGFYAAGRTRTPALLGVAGAVVFVAVALGLRGRLGQVAVSVALVASNGVQLVVAVPLLARALPPLQVRPILGSAGRTLGASLLALVVATGSAWALAADANAGALRRSVPGAVAVALFVASFLFAARALRSPELELVLRSVRRNRR